MNNLGDKLTQVNFSCVLVIFYYNWGTHLSTTWSLDSILCQDWSILLSQLYTDTRCEKNITELEKKAPKNSYKIFNISCSIVNAGQIGLIFQLMKTGICFMVWEECPWFFSESLGHKNCHIYTKNLEKWDNNNFTEIWSIQRKIFFRGWKIISGAASLLVC